MTHFQDMMRRAREDAEQGEWTPGPGSHDAIVVEGDAFESRAGDVYAKTTLRLVKPGHPDDGRTWDHLMGFKSPQQAAMSAAQLSLYGVENLDDLEGVDDLAAAMAELEGVHAQVTCKARQGGDGVWTNITGSRTGRSDIPRQQGAFSLGDREAASSSSSAEDDGSDYPF
jgi:hypothetical protein